MAVGMIDKPQEFTYPDVIAAATDGEVSAETIRRLCREGRFPRAVKVGRSWAIPSEDAMVFLREFDRYRSGTTQYVAAPPLPPGAAAPPSDDETGE